MVVVLTFKKLTVHAEKKSPKLADYRKSINMVLFKKDANSCVIRLPSATSFQLRLYNGHHYYPPTTDIQEKLLAANWEILDNYRIIKSLTLHFYIRIFVWNFIFLFQINYYFTATFLYI